MNPHDILQRQMDAFGLPLYAITVSAVPQTNTPLLAILHWHGFRRATPVTIPGIEIPPRPVASSAIQISERWRSFEVIDHALLDVAWQLGAWDLERLERRPCNTIGAPAGEALACRQAFGEYVDDRNGETRLVDEAPYREKLMRLAAENGYMRWTFRPVKGGIWQTVGDPDDTLQPDGGRRPPCPVLPQKTGRRNHVVYRLGRVRRIILS